MGTDGAICYKVEDLCRLLIPRVGLEEWLKEQSSIGGGVVA